MSQLGNSDSVPIYSRASAPKNLIGLKCEEDPMKKLVILMSTLVLSTGIQAKDRDIYDLMYLPKAGTGYGFSTLGFGQIKRESDRY